MSLSWWGGSIHVTSNAWWDIGHMVPLPGRHPPGRRPPQMVNVRVVCLLLKCILVTFTFSRNVSGDLPTFQIILYRKSEHASIFFFIYERVAIDETKAALLITMFTSWMFGAVFDVEMIDLKLPGSFRHVTLTFEHNLAEQCSIQNNASVDTLQQNKLSFHPWCKPMEIEEIYCGFLRS